MRSIEVLNWLMFDEKKMDVRMIFNDLLAEEKTLIGFRGDQKRPRAGLNIEFKALGQIAFLLVSKQLRIENWGVVMMF